MLSTERLQTLETVYHDGLLCDVVPFWMEHGLDKEYGGIMTGVDRRGNRIDDDKGVWQQGRFAWTLGFLCNHVERRPEWVSAAKGTLEFLRKYCYDRDGRMFFHMANSWEFCCICFNSFTDSWICSGYRSIFS